ncbi:DUF2975 domain-containing protein [Croceicoccus sp. BE223]|uniref:DUF2975 domain-containing protein n=1 Tax=Croceicoccus sp. BE223 TaxID=2817716 RepID=UPI00285BEA53|nr:DUF2975 domain-containing protein [Croceicoccus sp. BE223]MDR7102331.1 hypothetical protein [Croceicoccus sp. BE223]
MNRLRHDPLLGFARIVLSFFITVVCIGGAAIVVGLPLLLVFQRPVIAELAADGAPAAAFWGILGLLALVGAMLVLVFFFLRHLRRIVDTVAEGDPFVPDNADRLQAMAWLSLGAWAVNIPIQVLGDWVESVTEGSSVHIGVGDDGTSLALVLTLFILARVFRKGSDMRADLEGTV